MDAIERRVLEQVERNWERQLEFLQGMVRRPSTLGSEALVQRFIAKELSEMGLDVDLWYVDHAEIAKQPGYSPVEWTYEGRPNVAAVWRSPSDAGRSLIFNGHV
ncbi:MAG: acetylornithine deacetylase, partial [Actinomycetota bacterium]|nr:acetylornithine deacetylase [Actinomycetota bacterium]